MAKYGIATLLENHNAGYKFSPNNIPLHLTHVDSFQVELNVHDLTLLLTNSLADLSSFFVEATNDELYGPNKDIDVTEIELNPELLRLHSIISITLRNSDAIFKNPHFLGENFRPHVSAYGKRRIRPGDNILVDNLVIASKTSNADDATTRILAKIVL